MKKEDKKIDEKIVKPKGKIVLSFLLVLALATGAFAIYNLIKLRAMGGNIVKYIYLGIGAIAVFYLIIFIVAKRKLKKQKLLKRNVKKKGVYVSTILYLLITGLVGGLIFFFYGYVDSFNKEYVTYKSSLIVLSDSDCDNIKDVSDFVIGILEDKNSVDGYVIPREIIKENNLEDENEIVEYDNYTEMMSDLYSGDLDALFITADYHSIFNGIEAYANIDSETKVIISKEKKVKKSSTSKRESSSRGKSVTEPFTILLMGVDSPQEGLDKNTVANGDSLILITFNPKTLNATMLSIPRDSYVPISCWSGKPENKITHAAAYGTDCMMSTIEDYFDVHIDYYAKINFKGLVSLVNALGGIDVDVPADLCTDNSNREEVVCIKKGEQHLDGEGALVLSRNRKQLANGDLGRGQNQQLVISAMLNKVRKIRSASKFLKVLDTISNNFDTNFTTDQILSFYSVLEDLLNNDLAKDDGDIVNIQQLFLQGSGQMIFDERAGMILWDYIPNKDSQKDIIEAMKVNLGAKTHDDYKSFSFSIEEDYEKEIVGYGPYRKSYNYTLVPDFTGLTQAQAQALANRYGVKVTFEGKTGTVVSQSAPASKRVDKLSGSVKLVLSSNKTVKEDDDTTTKKKSTTTDDDSKDKKTTTDSTDITDKTNNNDTGSETTTTNPTTPTTDSSSSSDEKSDE